MWSDLNYFHIHTSLLTLLQLRLLFSISPAQVVRFKVKYIFYVKRTRNENSSPCRYLEINLSQQWVVCSLNIILIPPWRRLFFLQVIQRDVIPRTSWWGKGRPDLSLRSPCIFNLLSSRDLPTLFTSCIINPKSPARISDSVFSHVFI